jgi:hypothetical protein
MARAKQVKLNLGKILRARNASLWVEAIDPETDRRK